MACSLQAKRPEHGQPWLATRGRSGWSFPRSGNRQSLRGERGTTPAKRDCAAKEPEEPHANAEENLSFGSTLKDQAVGPDL